MVLKGMENFRKSSTTFGSLRKCSEVFRFRRIFGKSSENVGKFSEHLWKSLEGLQKVLKIVWKDFKRTSKIFRKSSEMIGTFDKVNTSF